MNRQQLIGAIAAQIRWIESKIRVLQDTLYCLELRLGVELKLYREEIQEELDRDREKREDNGKQNEQR